MDRKQEILVPVWFLAVVEDTLRIQHNINCDKETGETCQDRNIKQSLNGLRKLLSGEELTGGERLEKLKPYVAEKDLALTWEDIREICKLSVIVEVDKGREISDEHHYGEVLRRFNEKRKEK